MSRKNEPWYWEARKGWYVTINGKRKKLSKNKGKAFEAFYKLKADNPTLSTDSLIIVMDEMVEWTRKNRSAGTFQFYQVHAQEFINWLKSEKLLDVHCGELTVDTFESYLEDCSAGRRSGAVQMIKRVYNWSNKRGRIKVNPIMALEKPSSGRRDNLVSEAIYKKMLQNTDQNLSDLITFMWETGCRPQEAWRLRVEHVQLKYNRLCLPKMETKRKKGDRHIYCTKGAWEIVLRLSGNEDYLFVNQAGTQWNKDNAGKRMDNLKEHVGKRYALYDIRHSWITTKVKSGMDIHMIAKLAGTSIAMIERHYDKSDEDAQFMLTALLQSAR